MSTFSGFFDEIPNISADRFYYENLRSKLFFLSHCHTDHMKGLSLYTTLRGPLYVSAISGVILKKLYPNITDIRILEIDTSYELEYPDTDGSLQKFVVTALPARHCPGSVMFLFETHRSTILYTGDFRLSKQDFKKLSPLADKKIDVVYIDSTFLDERFQHFPPQLESVKTIVQLSKEWLSLDEDKKILIESPANYGYEYLFMELGKSLKCKIHVNQDKWSKYIYIPDMDNYISQNESECRIFTTLKKQFHPLRSDRDTRVIVASAFYWKFWKEGDPVFLLDEKSREIRVPLSNHSSLTEIKDFLDFIKPKEVKLNVISNDEDDKRKQLLLESILQNIERKNAYPVEQTQNPKEFFDSNKIFTIPKDMSSQVNEDCNKGRKFGILPKRKKR